jgi:hypothetical protein
VTDMSGSLKDAVVEKFPWLLNDLGFRISSDYYDYKHMGCSQVELTSDSLRVRFTRDELTTLLEVASAARSERWFEMGTLWLALKGERPQPQLDGWAWFFRDHLAEITEALGPQIKSTTAAFDRQEREARESSERIREHFRASVKPHPLLRLKRLFLGPLGWLLAGALLIWELTK